MITCTKRFSDIPFAHRAHLDKGDCSRIHGHSWAFEFTWEGTPDACGFIVDFGSLGWLKDWIRDNFDHCFVFNADDAESEKLVRSSEFFHMFKPRPIPSCSSEGIAAYVFRCVSRISEVTESPKAKLVRVVVYEDGKNSASYTDNEWLET